MTKRRYWVVFEQELSIPNDPRFGKKILFFAHESKGGNGMFFGAASATIFNIHNLLASAPDVPRRQAHCASPFSPAVSLGKLSPSPKDAGKYLSKYSGIICGPGSGCAAVDMAIELEGCKELVRRFGALTSEDVQQPTVPVRWTAQLTRVDRGRPSRMENSRGFLFLQLQ